MTYDSEREKVWLAEHWTAFLRLEPHHIPGYLVACGVRSATATVQPLADPGAFVNGDHLTVDPDSILDIVLIHEAAHLLTPGENHSPLWAATFVDLVTRIKNESLADSLEAIL